MTPDPSTSGSTEARQEPEHGWVFDEPRMQALRDAYWQHRERPNVHSDAPCQDKCFPDITERWVNLMAERAALAPLSTTTPDAEREQK